MKDHYDEDRNLVTCGSRKPGCIGLKDYDEDSNLFLPDGGGDVSAAKRDALATAAQDINDAITTILAGVEENQPKPAETTGFDMVVTQEGFRLAYCKRADKVLTWRPPEERGLLLRFLAWLARPAYFKRQ